MTGETNGDNGGLDRLYEHEQDMLHAAGVPVQETRQSGDQLTAQEVLAVGSELLYHFGVEVDSRTDLEGFLAAIKQLNPRSQGEHSLVRWRLERDQREWPEATKTVIAQTAESMCMLLPETPLPADSNLAVVIGLGAGRNAPLDRAQYGVKSAQEQNVQVGQHVGVGSARDLEEDEQKIVAGYAPGAQVEFDLTTAAYAKVAKENPGLLVSTVFVDKKRASTQDVVGAALNALEANGNLKEGVAVAAVTTQIYQVATSLDVARIAREFGVTNTMVAGNPSDPTVVANRTISTYFSEVLRTLRSAALAVHAEDQYLAQKTTEIQTMLQDDERVIESGWIEGRGAYVVVEDASGGHVVHDEQGSWTAAAADGKTYDGPDDSIGSYS